MQTFDKALLLEAVHYSYRALCAVMNHKEKETLHLKLFVICIKPAVMGASLLWSPAILVQVLGSCKFDWLTCC